MNNRSTFTYTQTKASQIIIRDSKKAHIDSWSPRRSTNRFPIAKQDLPIRFQANFEPKRYFSPRVAVIWSVARPWSHRKFRIAAKNVLFNVSISYFFSGIDRSPTMRRPSTRRDSKKSWKMDHNHERNTTGMKDEPMTKMIENEDEQIDFQSATASSLFHCHLLANLGITTITAILAGGMST